MTKILLELRDADVFYGANHVLRQLNLSVRQGQIVALLGANGAGKTTTLRALSGMLPLAAGKRFFQGRDITGLPSEKIARLGLSHCPENRQIFPDLTVLENLMVGAYSLSSSHERAKQLDRCYRSFPILKSRSKQLGMTLSGGEQQMLAIARALMSSPELLLLDEPSLGLAPLIVKDIMRIVQDIASEGTTVLIVEQNAAATLKIADHAYVLHVGQMIAQGSAKSLLADPKLKEAYLGQDARS